ncbi:hypothetical protein [Herbidospora mongoliensis]|uniref:hypothetical protein n=1 Tax=Herbidospora mongoliensis TaxID=688067 RepID=UPI00082A9AB8|nr:hypothetical protein [Herbidospora mongoliensis]
MNQEKAQHIMSRTPLACSCGVDLPDQVTAELHASEANLCTACFGTMEEEPFPGWKRRCLACAGTGRRGPQLVWELAHVEAETVIPVRVVLALLPGRPFRLSELADLVRERLSLAPGQLPVGPRVRDVLLQLQQEGEVALISAPEQLMDEEGAVLYEDPYWVRTVR